MIRTAITEIFQDIAIWLAFMLVLRWTGETNIMQYIVITVFFIAIAVLHYNRGLRFGLRYVVTSFIKENIEK